MTEEVKPHVTYSEANGLCVEWWNGERKLTLYGDNTYIKSWGTSIFNEMEDGIIDDNNSVQDLMKWLLRDTKKRTIKKSANVSKEKRLVVRNAVRINKK